jgi:hypothetical protein
MDAVRIEGSHIEKVLGRRTQLQRILREENLDPSDRQIFENLEGSERVMARIEVNLLANALSLYRRWRADQRGTQ